MNRQAPRRADAGGPTVAWQVVAVVVLFLGSGLAGERLSTELAPSSWLASAVGMFAFPLAFAAGMQLWLGFAVLSAIVHLLRGHRGSGGVRSVPPGSQAFMPVSVLAGGVAGPVVAACGSHLGWGLTIGLYLVLGAGYGLACWTLARKGFLPFPES